MTEFENLPQDIAGQILKNVPASEQEALAKKIEGEWNSSSTVVHEHPKAKAVGGVLGGLGGIAIEGALAIAGAHAVVDALKPTIDTALSAPILILPRFSNISAAENLGALGLNRPDEAKVVLGSLGAAGAAAVWGFGRDVANILKWPVVLAGIAGQGVADKIAQGIDHNLQINQRRDGLQDWMRSEGILKQAPMI